MGLHDYQLHGELEATFSKDFRLLLPSVNLETLGRKEIAERLPDEAGCYFWILVCKKNKYRIYLGRTNSIRKRVTDYSIEFQMHSPNDFKIRFFQEFVQKELPEAELDLYFAPTPLEECRVRETNLVRLYRPVINERAAATKEEKALIKSAFSDFYGSVFGRKLL
jgi:hypothetical protein